MADWIDVMHDIYTMEKLTFSLRLEWEKFKRLWANLIKHITPIRLCF